MGVQAFADALLIIPKTLAKNGGFDVLDAVVALQDEAADGNIVVSICSRVSLVTRLLRGIWDNYRVKRQMIQSRYDKYFFSCRTQSLIGWSSSVIAVNLLSTDEIPASRRSSLKIRRSWATVMS